ncbi:hypothetical protein DFQ27_003245 [Actinomortierella ambigua]|uniref:C3H1-type domain-containing protein n=1 Tax=Actinomortierella ambigua TaxID=1343610 RepID=A0A9P6Q741_9FUNG|nr:hypothetical protein DFQ27_003245 [Actinomortierella ambigua]
MSRATTAVVARRPPSQTSKGSAAATLQRRHRSCSVASSTTSTDSAPSVKSCLSSAAVAMASSSPPAPAAAVLTSSTKSGQQQQQQQRGKHSSLLPPHQHQQLQQQLNYKTEYCTRFQESGGHCPFGDRCQFAHDASELQRRPRSLTYKTRPCWSGDSCLYQQNHQRCIYLHGSETPEMFDEQRGITFAKVQQICAKKAMKQQQQQQQTKSKLKNDQRLSMPAIPSPSMTAPPKNPLLSATTQQDATTATAASSSSSRRRIHRSQTLPSMTPVEAAASGIPASIQSATDAVQRKQDAQDHMTVALLPPPPPHPSAATALQEQEQLQSDSAHHTNNGRVMSWLFTDQANQQPQPSQQSACSRRKPFEALSNLRTTSTDEGGAVDGSDSASGSLPSFPQGYDLVSDAPSSSSSSSLPREPISRTTSTSAAPQQGQSMQVFQKPTFLSRSNRWSKSGAKKACPPKALSLSSLAEEELLSPARSAARLASPALALMHTLRTPTRPTVSGAAATVGMPVIGSHYAVLPVPVGASASASAAPVAATYDPFSMKTMMMMPMLPPSMSMPMPGQPMPLLPPQPLMNTNHHNKSMMMMTMTTGFPGATAMSMHSKTDRSLLFSPGTPLTDMIPVLGLEQLESWKDICFDD